MDVLLIEPPPVSKFGNMRQFGSIGSYKAKIAYPPIDLMKIAGYLRKLNISAYMKLGRWDDAIDMMERSIPLDTYDNPDLRWRLGRSYLEIGEYKKAVYWLRKAFKMSPEGRTENYLNTAIKELEKQKKQGR